MLSKREWKLNKIDCPGLNKVPKWRPNQNPTFKSKCLLLQIGETRTRIDCSYETCPFMFWGRRTEIVKK